MNQDVHIGSSFSRASRDTTPSRNPGPNAYTPVLRPRTSYITMKGTYSPDKIYLKNYQRYMKGKISPGPAKYNVSDTKIVKKAYISKVGRDAYEMKRESPGPGAYFKSGLHAKTRSVSFGTGSRDVDVRNYGKSDEMFKS
mmetsp:Transcript_16506/g.16442  ORF Transcript_16506/g.16442 Transcript_16506/m.16442 type:complete len:140 (-) Transcript_16506:58-477(-)